MKFKDNWLRILFNVLFLIIFAVVSYAYNRDISSLEKKDIELGEKIEKKVDKDYLELIREDLKELKKDVKQLLKK